MQQEFTYEHQGNNSFLVYQFSETDKIDTLTLAMLTNNKIPHFAQMLYTQQDTKQFVKYNITSMITAAQIFTGEVKKKYLLGILDGIVSAIIASEEYMIDPSCLLLSSDKIFVNVTTGEANLICLPLTMTSESPVDYKDLFKKILFSAQYDLTESSDYLLSIISYLNSSIVFSINDFKKILGEVMVSPEKVKNAVSVGNESVSSPVRKQVQHTVENLPVPPANPIVTSPADNMQPMTLVSPSKIEQTETDKKLPQIPKAGLPGKSVLPTSDNKKLTAKSNMSVEQEEKISLFYLMQHYNKENAAKYKAQKEKKKEKKMEQSLPAVPVAQSVPIQPPVPRRENQLTPPEAFSTPSSVSPSVRLSDTVAEKPIAQPSVNVTVPVTANFGETTVLNVASAGETTVLMSNMSGAGKTHAFIIRERTNEHVQIDKPFFRIGSERSYVDYFIGNNSAISRGHANILVRGTQYFIVDTNSKNFTYVNERQLVSGDEVEIHSGDRLKLADEYFGFYIN